MYVGEMKEFLKVLQAWFFLFGFLIDELPVQHNC